jgi:hypothetical protein
MAFQVKQTFYPTLHSMWVTAMLSPYRPESFDGYVKNKLPGKLFFFDHKTVPLYRTHVLCTQGRRNISLIGWTEVGSLSVFEWADT